MYKSILLSCAIATISISAQANSWLDVATAVLNAKNANAAAEAESNIDRTRAQANAAIALANAHALANQNQQAVVTQVTPAANAAISNNGIYTTAYLKTLDCTDLMVEARSFERTVQAAEAQVASSSNNVNSLATLATGALSAFAGQSESMARASQITSMLTGKSNQTNAKATITQAEYDNAITNLENIQIYRQAKKCS